MVSQNFTVSISVSVLL